ncbi:dihydroxyacetone kinase [Streptomyces himastatinicus ATCC 53653]|uniref:Dihydroxyacetone kinase n=1 Tax=Streptomyces himastatinicus ATCC 53653 TaxID=457427 RepID=D9WFE6_9ACTN|nr:dihydroxyacetone kinase family protein [Streptomyces himastatinicus]EFL28904.1 dihydroxyacetone kinase [Streptomyces himastatinicus ATCC 53653]
MTRLFNDPATFTEDMLAGFLDANSGYVAGVPGGVVRARETPPGKVAVVVGGGSGHYPAFCGVVGRGFADGAVVGNIFTSPSAQEAYTVAKAAAGDAGVLILSGNYAGDVLNFTSAAQRLTAEGTAARVLFVTDDLASAPAAELDRRRGVAGDFVVFRVAGAAAEAGYDLDAVEKVARRANDCTRTLGVAFSGCTLPGAQTPLFTVPDRRMGVGLGIHGEPGVSEAALPSAADLAAQLVDGVLAERPANCAGRIAVVLNGLGATKYEELFVLWATVSKLLAERGLTVVEPEVGELVTSLDMAGVSLTVTFLDEELESLWRAPADTPAYRKGLVGLAQEEGGSRLRSQAVQDDAPVEVAQVPHATPASRHAAAAVVAALNSMRTALTRSAEELGRIDAVAGDGDHGRGMVKGVTAAVEAATSRAEHGAGVATVLTAAGDAWAAKAGGTSGALWGAGLRAAGERLTDVVPTITAQDVSDAVRCGLDTIVTIGKAALGDKTLLDAALPFADVLEAAIGRGTDLRSAWNEAATAAHTAALATADLVPKTGRARPLAARSVGTPDAGAVSYALCVQSVLSTRTKEQVG